MKKIALLLALVSLPLLANANNLVVNGSFESNMQANGTWSIYNNLTGWKGVAELRNNAAGEASDGLNYVELDAYKNGSIFQKIATVAGTEYILSFDYSPRENVASNSNKVKAYWNDTLLETITGKGANSGNVWETYTYSVLGTGLDKLKFSAAGKSDGLGGSLDNVSLVSAVPEPQTYGMTLMGLGLIGFVARRRKNTIEA